MFAFDFGRLDDPGKPSERLQRAGDVAGAKVRPSDARGSKHVRNRAEMPVIGVPRVKPNSLA